MVIELVHVVGSRIELWHDDSTLFRYIYEPGTDPTESPKPYFHPLQTLAGNEATLYRPHDHPWHTGLAMTSAYLSGENFWGGPTFDRDEGYVHRDNHGRIEHAAWGEISCDDGVPSLQESLRWVAHDGAVWIHEERRISVGEIDAASGCWRLDLSFRLENVAGFPLVFGSPTTQGRPQAGYGGLFWRGPLLHGGRDTGSERARRADVMGAKSPWLAYRAHDGSGDKTTILFVDGLTNLRHLTKWFVRDELHACASCSMFDEEYTLGPDGARPVLRRRARRR
ncbi:MAG: PmoA family protein [Chloroflexia bacterium]